MELEQLVSLFTGFLSQEHKEDGTHSDVTADTVTIAELLTVTGYAARLRFGSAAASAYLEGGTTTGRYDVSLYPTVSTAADVLTPVLKSERSVVPVTDDSVNLGALSDVPANHKRWRNVLFSRTCNGPVVAADTAFYERSRSTPVGEWATVTYAAGNFTASTGTWTVDSGDQVTLAYMLVGKSMTVAFEIDGTDVSAAPARLMITIPGGFTAAKRMRNLIQVVDAGAVATVGVALVNASSTTIDLFASISGTAWTATAGDNTNARGEITFEVA
jgi:hypothetical protein